MQHKIIFSEQCNMLCRNMCVQHMYTNIEQDAAIVSWFYCKSLYMFRALSAPSSGVQLQLTVTGITYCNIQRFYIKCVLKTYKTLIHYGVLYRLLSTAVIVFLMMVAESAQNM
jgi:hypothetical protein